MIVCYHILQQHFKPSIYTSTINVLKRSTISEHKVATCTGLQGKDDGGDANESMVMGRNALLTINLSGLGLKHSINFSYDLQLTFHYSYHN